jgi:hypothetical protein
MPRLLAPVDMAYTEIESPFAQFPLAAVGTGGLAETPIGLVGPGPLNLDLASVSIHPVSAWVANNSNYFIVTINRRTNAAPAVAVAVAIGTAQISGASAMGNGVQWKANNMFVQAGTGSILQPNDAITVVVTEGGTGLALPQSFIGIYLKGF